MVLTVKPNYTEISCLGPKKMTFIVFKKMPKKHLIHKGGIAPFCNLCQLNLKL